MPFVAPNILDRKFRSGVQPAEWAAILYCLVMILVCAVFQNRIPGWYLYAAWHAAFIFWIGIMVRAESEFGRLLRAFDMCLYIPVFFFMLCLLAPLLHPGSHDTRLIAIDRSIGGIDLLRWMRGVEGPRLTGASQWVWFTHYFLPLLPAVALYRRAVKTAFEETKLMFMLGYLLSFVTYLLMPTGGPGCHLEKLGLSLPTPDPFTRGVREALFSLEGDARIAFPSGPVLVATLVIFACLRNRLWLAAAFGIPLSLGVIWSTFYLRDHYLIDAIAGVVLAAFCAGAGIRWYHRHDEGKIR